MKDTKKRRTLIRPEDLTPCVEWSCKKCKEEHRVVGCDEFELQSLRTIDCGKCGTVHTFVYT